MSSCSPKSKTVKPGIVLKFAVKCRRFHHDIKCIGLIPIVPLNTVGARLVLTFSTSLSWSRADQMTNRLFYKKCKYAFLYSHTLYSKKPRFLVAVTAAGCFSKCLIYDVPCLLGRISKSQVQSITYCWVKYVNFQRPLHSFAPETTIC